MLNESLNPLRQKMIWSIDLRKRRDKNRKIKFSKLKRKIFKNTRLVRLLLFFILLIVSYVLILAGSASFKNSEYGFYLKSTKVFLFGSSPDFQDQTDGRTNILLMGKGGEIHEAGDLTDAVMLVSLSKNDIKVISLPRDIWIPELRAKLNSVYYWGNQKNEGGGLVLSKSVVESITGTPIHYVVIVDFSGFTSLIDVIGDIEVDVENSFVDNRYPITGKENDNCGGDPEFACRYKTLTFEEGKQFMNSSRALEYVRSRNSEGDEGTDFARNNRQQIVVDSILNKILSFRTLSDPAKLRSIRSIFHSSVETNMSEETMVVVARNFLKSKDTINTIQIPDKLLENPPRSSEFDNLYVLTPVGDNWEDFKIWIKCVLWGNESC